jgi:hypothetical protein
VREAGALGNCPRAAIEVEVGVEQADEPDQLGAWEQVWMEHERDGRPERKCRQAQTAFQHVVLIKSAAAAEVLAILWEYFPDF